MAATAWDITPDVHEFDEAVSWFQKRTVLTADDALKLNERARSSAFWVGGGLQLQQVQDVFQALDKSIAKGETFDEFRARLKTNLKPAHAKIVFRNATQRAYNAGRYEQMTQPDVLKFRPFWMYDSVLDSRTTTICKGYNKTTLPATDEWWATRIPPNHHGCRASIRSLRRAEAERRGITTEPDQTQPAEGWAVHPLSPVGPPTGKDNRLVTELTRKTVKPVRLRKTKPKAPVKGPPLEHTPEHWVAHYAPKYGEAAKSLGWGRAMQERGFDMSADEALARWDAAGLPMGPERRAAFERAGKRTVAEALGRADRKTSAIAAVAGHIASITPLKVTLEGTRLGTALRAELNQAEKFLGAVVSNKLKDPRYKVRQIGKRAEADFVTSEIRLPATSKFWTVAHEWSHALEVETVGLLQRAIDWLNARRGTEPYRRLPDLINGHPDKNHFSFRDELSHVYIGKRYTLKVPYKVGVNQVAAGEVFGTEVTAMGANAIIEDTTDLEHLLFTLGQYSGQ